MPSSWRLMIALAVELVPGVALFPSWTVFVATLRAADAGALEAPPPEKDALVR